MESTGWPDLRTELSTAFDRPRALRRPGPLLKRDLGGLSDWAYAMDANRMAERHRIVKAAMEINRQRAAGPDLRCDYCGMFQPRWEMDVQLRDGVERFQCAGCAHAAWLGLASRLELGSVPRETEFRA